MLRCNKHPILRDNTAAIGDQQCFNELSAYLSCQSDLATEQAVEPTEPGQLGQSRLEASTLTWLWSRFGADGNTMTSGFFAPVPPNCSARLLHSQPASQAYRPENLFHFPSGPCVCTRSAYCTVAPSTGDLRGLGPYPDLLQPQYHSTLHVVSRSLTHGAAVTSVQ